MKKETYVCDFCRNEFSKTVMSPVRLLGVSSNKYILESNCLEYSEKYLANFGDACKKCIETYAIELYKKFEMFGEGKK